MALLCWEQTCYRRDGYTTCTTRRRTFPTAPCRTAGGSWKDAGDTVKATVTVADINHERGRVFFSTVCTVGGKEVVAGDAQLMVTRRAALKAAE